MTSKQFHAVVVGCRLHLLEEDEKMVKRARPNKLVGPLFLTLLEATLFILVEILIIQFGGRYSNESCCPSLDR